MSNFYYTDVNRIAMRFAELGHKQPAVSSGALYAVFDGLFQKYLLKHIAGDPCAITVFLGEVKALLPIVA